MCTATGRPGGAAADVCNALSQSRRHRDALSAGRLDGEAVDAVLGAAGRRVRRRPSLPAGLSPREVQVLVLLARGLPIKRIAEQLSVSAHTVSSHVEHVYTKIGVTTDRKQSRRPMRAYGCSTYFVPTPMLTGPVRTAGPLPADRSRSRPSSTCRTVARCSSSRSPIRC